MRKHVAGEDQSLQRSIGLHKHTNPCRAITTTTNCHIPVNRAISVLHLASFPGSTSQLFSARSKISLFYYVREVEPGNKAMLHYCYSVPTCVP